MTAGSIALGIGAITAMYSVIYAVLLDPFPYKDVAHLVSPALCRHSRTAPPRSHRLGQVLPGCVRSYVLEADSTAGRDVDQVPRRILRRLPGPCAGKA
jgi:hypothetical protein